MARNIKQNVFFGQAECFVFVISFTGKWKNSMPSKATLLSDQSREIGVNATFWHHPLSKQLVTFI
jgi:hypothetical protein